jgi:hypothetical protein
MSLPNDVRDTAIRQVEQFCEERLPEDARAQMRLEVAVKGARITLVERHAPWNEELGGDWTIQAIAELRSEDVDAASDVGPLLAEIDADPEGVFWG